MFAVRLTICLAFFLSADISVGDTIYSDSYYLSIRVDLHGGPKITANIARSVFLFPLQEVLRQENVQNELELVDYQKKAIKELYIEIDKVRVSIYKKYGSAKLSVSQIEELQEYRKGIEARLSDIFMPHQLSQLEEISNFVSLNQMGIGRFLEVFAKSRSISIDRSSLRTAIANTKAVATERSNELARRQRDKILKVLDSEQSRKLENLLPEQYCDSISLELFYLDLLNEKRQNESDSSDDNVVDMLGRLGGFKMGPDGSWSRYDRRMLPEHILINELASSITAMPHRFPELKLTEQELTGIAALIDETIAQLLHLRMNRPSTRRVGGENAAQIKYNQQKIEFLREQARGFKRIVSPDRMDALKPRLIRSVIIANGLVSELIGNDWLHEELNLRSSQVEELKSICAVSRKKVLAELEKLASDSIEDVLNSQNDELEIRFKQEMGSRPKYLLPLPSFILR